MITWEELENCMTDFKQSEFIFVEDNSIIGEMKRLAASKNGKCLSKNYINSKTKLLWQCEKGHKWEAIPSSIKVGTWCPKCSARRSGRKKLTIEEMQKIALSREGKFGLISLSPIL